MSDNLISSDLFTVMYSPLSIDSQVPTRAVTDLRAITHVLGHPDMYQKPQILQRALRFILGAGMLSVEGTRSVPVVCQKGISNRVSIRCRAPKTSLWPSPPKYTHILTVVHSPQRRVMASGVRSDDTDNILKMLLSRAQHSEMLRCAISRISSWKKRNR